MSSIFFGGREGTEQSYDCSDGRMIQKMNYIRCMFNFLSISQECLCLRTWLG